MIIVCTNCSASYTIPDEKAPKHRVVTVCKKCQHKIVIEPDPVIEPVPGLGGPLPSGPSRQAIETFNNLLLSDFPILRSLPSNRYAFWKFFLPGDEGGYKNRPNKSKVKLLSTVDPILDGILNKNETVLFAAGAIERSPFDILLVNRWITGLYNRYALIGTEQRLLMINVNKGLKRQLFYIFQRPYRLIKSVNRGLLKNGIVLKPRGGRKWAFRSIGQSDSEALHGFLLERIEPESDKNEIQDPDEHICPACFKPFNNASNCCPHCDIAFKSPVGAAIRSLILPGWGNFYLGRRLLGILEMLVSAAIWLIVLDAFVANNHYVAFMAIYVAAIYNGCDGILTFFTARKGYSLKTKEVPKVS